MNKFRDNLIGRSSTTILVVVRPSALLAKITGDRVISTIREPGTSGKS
jgi:hypothetical protein